METPQKEEDKRKKYVELGCLLKIYPTGGDQKGLQSDRTELMNFI